MNIDVIIDERLIKSAVAAAAAAEAKVSSTDDDDFMTMTASTIRTNVISEGERKSFVQQQQQQQQNNTTANSSRSGSFIVKSTTTTTNNNDAQSDGDDEEDKASTTTNKMCRICHSDSQLEDMIVPCKCSGSLKYVHQECLQSWLKTNGSKSCEICKDEFIIKMRANALNRWKKPTMSRDQRRKFLLMNFLYLVAILCNLWSINSFSGVLLMQFRLGIYDWKFYMIVFFSLSTLFCIIWFLVSLVQIWFDFCRKFFRYNQSIVIRSKF